MSGSRRTASVDDQPWTLGHLVDASGIDAARRGDAEIAGVSHDSRTVSRGDLFCCIPGAVYDGHDFAAAAVDGGAAALLVERWLDLDVPQVKVARVRAALGPLAHEFYRHPSASMDVVAVTGTNGKTTVTYLIEAMATAAGRSSGVVGSIERRLGNRRWPPRLNMPESLELDAVLAQMRDAGGEVVAVEVTSEGIDQGRIDGMRFACAAFTNLTQDHLNYHGTMDAYFEAKARLFDERYTARAAINVGDEWGRRLAGRCVNLELVTFGSDDADVCAFVPQITPDGTSLRLRTPDGEADVRTQLVGPYNVENLLCAAAVCTSLGLGLDAVVAGAAAVTGVPGRLEAVVRAPFTALVDYAHTPDALRNALGAARALARGGRVIVVFGCGGDRDRTKRALMGEAATRAADLTIVTSDNPRSEDPGAIVDEIVPGAERGGGAYRVVVDRRTAIADALRWAQPGDVVLVAGKGHETGQILRDRTVAFDDREVIREFVEARCSG